MSTKGIYKFWDIRFPDEGFYVYKQYDNYPQGAADHIESAKGFAWELPRYEADEFASAFIAANKNPRGGEVRLISSHFTDQASMLDCHRWCDFFYEVRFKDGEDFWIAVHESRWHPDNDSEFHGTFKWVEVWQGWHRDMAREFDNA